MNRAWPILLVLAGAPGLARAQTTAEGDAAPAPAPAAGSEGAAAEPDGASAEQEGAYQELIRKGLQEYELAHWDEAKSYFAQAHAIQPSARTLRGLSLVSYELRDYVAALGFARDALASEVRPLTAEMRAELERIRAQADGFVCSLHVVLQPESAAIRIDARPAELDPEGRVLLNPGTHELVAEAPGFESASRSVEAQSGEKLELLLTLRKITSAPEVAIKREPRSVAPWIVTGVAGAVAVTGVVLIALALSDISSVEQARDGTRWSSVKSAYDRAPALSSVGFVMLGVGAAGTAAGLSWALWPKRTEPAASVALRLAPGQIHIAGHF